METPANTTGIEAPEPAPAAPAGAAEALGPTEDAPGALTPAPQPETLPANEPELSESAPEGDSEPSTEPAPDEALKGLPPKVQERLNRRFAQLTARAKGAEEKASGLQQQLDGLREQADGAAPEAGADPALQAAAEQAGIPAQLLTKTDAQTLANHAAAERRADAFEDWLEENADPAATMQVYENGQPRDISRSEVVRARRFWRAEQKRLEPRAATLRGQYETRLSRILRLGLDAEKRTRAAPAARLSAAPPPAAAAGARPQGAVAPAAPTAGTRLSVTAPAAGAQSEVDYSKITTSEELAKAIERSRPAHPTR